MQSSIYCPEQAYLDKLCTSSGAGWVVNLMAQPRQGIVIAYDPATREAFYGTPF